MQHECLRQSASYSTRNAATMATTEAVRPGQGAVELADAGLQREEREQAVTHWEAESIHWKAEAEDMRRQLRAATEGNAALRGELAKATARLTLLESALRSVGRTACNYVDITKQ